MSHSLDKYFIQEISIYFMFLYFLLGGFGQVVLGQGVSIRNTSAARTDSVITITYDLLGEEDETFQVTLLVSKSNGETSLYEPQAVSGDVGLDVSPGTGKHIRWLYRKDLPTGLRSDVEYRVVAEEERGNGWIYVLGTVLTVGGGALVAVFIGLIGEGDDGRYPTPPTPPGP